MLMTRGVRGAISVEEDSPDSIIQATSNLLLTILEANPGLAPEDLASVLFTMTDDLRSAYPAAAARSLGWDDVPLLCASEIAVQPAIPKVIRVLLHWNTTTPQSAIKHVYLERAAALRPDLVQPQALPNGPTGLALEQGPR